MTTEVKKPFRILSLDGGGVRAIIQAQILARIVREYPNFLKEVDLFCGTSAGAIVASALCSGISPAQTVGLYEQEVGKIFSEQLSRRVFSVDNAIGAAYTPEELSNMLTKEFGDKKLCDLPQKLFIPTFRLDSEELYAKNGREDNQPVKPTCRWTPEFLHNLPHSKNSDTKVVDAVLRTTAAPTYFPVYQGFIDGGVVANNPSLAALTTAIAGKQTKLEDVVILSLSTGSNPKGIHQSGNANWGLLEWSPHIVELLLDSSTEAIDYQCRCLVNEKYHRIDPFLPRDIGLDDASALPELKEIANEFNLTAVKEWIDTFWKSDIVDTSDLDMSIEDLRPDDVKVDPNANAWRCIIQ